MFGLDVHFILITFIISAFIILVDGGLSEAPNGTYFCDTSSFRICGTGFSIRYPFHYLPGEDYSDDCGYSGLEVHCSDDYGRAEINISNNLYYILNTESRTLRVVGKDVYEEECPRPTKNFTLDATSPFSSFTGNNITYFYNCSTGYPEDVVQHLPCLDAYYNNTTTPGLRSFAFNNDDFPNGGGYNWYTNCQQTVHVPVLPSVNDSDYKQGLQLGFDYKQGLKLGFDLRWHTPHECLNCEESGGNCFYNETSRAPPLCSCLEEQRMYHGSCPKKVGPTAQIKNTTSSGLTRNTTGSAFIAKERGLPTGIKVIIGVCTGVGGLLATLLLIYRRKCSALYRSIISRWKFKIKTPTNVEAFLESCGCLGLQKYNYREIKKMTNSFKEMLGQGGFGSVFKGKLCDGRLVAVKVLNDPKGNGEDFINEVATIGWTNHVNVVRLLGFCSSGTKRALVYEFMPNGSLEKFIYDQKDASTTNHSLGWEKIYQIALAIAKGLEYLHCGCNTRILHFDIKPHNILLDKDFCPKISDFGLAKLCETRESLVSIQVARGTAGYAAPEVGCRNLGKVSHKSDIYSYGMMTLEMIGRRKNLDVSVGNTSEIYFPQWIYNHLKQDITEEECQEIYKEKRTKKMIITALWCIQIHPSDRPSISKVVEMLEGDVEELQMPPNPFHGSLSESSP